MSAPWTCLHSRRDRTWRICCVAILLGSTCLAASGDDFASLRRLPSISPLSHDPAPLSESQRPRLVQADTLDDASPIDVADFILSSKPTTPSDGLLLTSKAVFGPSSPDITFKLRGYVKGDIIHDFDAIESTDNFNTSTIEIGREGENTRLHARQTRLILDVEWPTRWGDSRIFIEGDFFGAGDSFRLRHAYGSVGRWLAGQTWTTFTHIEALPSTLDFESPIAFVLTRRGMVRWTYEVVDGLDLAVAVEDPRVTVASTRDIPSIPFDGEKRTPSPDLVARIRHTSPVSQLQFAGIARQLGFQQDGGPIVTERGYGFILSGFRNIHEVHKLMFQAGFGEGVGGLRGILDAVPNPTGDLDVLDFFGFTCGYEVQWTERWKSTAAYSYGRLNNSPLQLPDAIHSVDYLAVNLVWNPLERIYTGIEYLYGTRQDFDGASGSANRIHMSFWYNLP